MSDPNTGAAHTSMRDILSIRNYRMLWQGQIVSNFGDSLTFFALILLVNRLSDGNPAAIAGVAIAAGLPTAIIGVLSGVFVDRWPRKRVMLISDILHAIVISALGIYVFVYPTPNLFVIYTFVFLMATVSTFFAPARMALIPTIVPHQSLMTANSLSQISQLIFSVLGTTAAGFIVGANGLFWPIFAIDGLTFVLSVYFISRVDVEEQRSPTKGSVAVIGRELRAGLSIIGRNRLLIGILIAASVTMLGFGAVNVLLPPLLLNDLQVSETWFGAVELSQGVAMVISGLLVGVIAQRFRPTRIITVALFIIGLLVALISQISSVFHLFPILFGIGLMMTPFQASAATILQTSVENEVRGRIGAAFNAVIQVASLTSMFAAGTLAASVGERNVFVIGGVIACLAAIAAGLIFRGATSTPAKADSVAV